MSHHLVFGVDRDPGSIETRRASDGPRLSDANPCVVAFGPGPEGETCRHCTHLYAQGGVSGRYLKCDQRFNTSGPATDHRAGWPACARFQPGREP